MWTTLPENEFVELLLILSSFFLKVNILSTGMQFQFLHEFLFCFLRVISAFVENAVIVNNISIVSPVVHLPFENECWVYIFSHHIKYQNTIEIMLRIIIFSTKKKTYINRNSCRKQVETKLKNIWITLEKFLPYVYRATIKGLTGCF